jgi:serine/threonine protein kinase
VVHGDAGVRGATGTPDGILEGVPAAKPPSEYLLGKHLGPYEVLKRIGHGATATVFEASHVETGRLVALKILHEHLAADPTVGGRFQREGKIASQLRHPNAIEVIDVGESNGFTYLVMERLEGVDLGAHLAKAGPLEVPEALAILLPIASALLHAHARGAIHRDVKPANIVLAKAAGEALRPTLVDFGLSKLTEDAAFLTSSEMVVGTAEYMAPETTLGSTYASPSSDQYSLAAVLYECVTDHLPVEAQGFVALIEAIRKGVHAPPSTFSPDVPPGFDPVVLRALHRNPEHRFPTLRGFARALLPFADEATARTLRADLGEPGSSSPEVEPVSAPRTRSRPGMGAARSTPPELRRLPCPAGSSPFRIKGMPYRGLVHFARTALPGGLDALCEQLDDDSLRQFVRQPFLATSRYDVLPFVPLSATLARMVGTSFDEFVRRASMAQARYDARTVYQRLYDGATKQDTPARIARFEAQQNDFGAFEAWFDGPDLLFLQRTGMPAYLAPWYGVMHPAYTQEATELIGAPARAVELPVVPCGKREGFDLVRTRCEVHWS